MRPKSGDFASTLGLAKLNMSRTWDLGPHVNWPSLRSQPKVKTGAQRGRGPRHIHQTKWAPPRGGGVPPSSFSFSFSSLSATSTFRLTHHHSRVGVSSTHLRYAHTSQTDRQRDRQLARKHGDREGGSSDSMIVVVVIIITSRSSPASPAPGVKLCHHAQLLFG